MKKFLLGMIVLILFISFTGISLNAAESKYINVDVSSGGLYCTPKVSHSQMKITVSAPNGVVYSKVFTGGGSNFVSISEICEGNLLNGSYTFEVTLYPQKNTLKRTDIENNKKKGIDINKNLIEPMLTHGHFTLTNSGVKGGNGSVLGNDSDQDVAGDQVILDDLIVDGSLCVGQDCVNGESFGFDTIRLKENNVRIRFVDTSSTSSFPSNDWQLTANDSSNGGANKFSIDDIDGGRTPFTLEAGAPSHSLYVDDGGRVGFGTSTPVVELHIKDGDTPTLRLEQDGSSGFTPQTFDVAANEANFFIRDATNGSTLPFRIQPGAPSNALFIAASGNIGIGTDSPSSLLHLSSSSTPLLKITHTGGSSMKLACGSGNVQICSTSNHGIKFIANSSMFMVCKPDLSLKMANGASCTSGGTWTNSSSRELKENIEILTDSEAIETINGLVPVKYNYKIEKDEEYIGFIAEDVPDLVATKDRKGMSPMDVVAVLTKVVQQQQKSIEELQSKIEKLEKKNNK